MTKTWMKKLYKDTRERMELMKIEYGIEELEDRITDKAKKILVATSEAEAHQARDKALASCSIHCIANGSRRTVDWLMKQAQKAKSRADSFERKGDHDAAEAQIKYMRKYEDEARSLRAEEG